jgi:uncharacterized membrane protein
MGKLMTLLSGASLGAGGMYLMDPERGHRRRAELRDALAEVDTDELMERARHLEPVKAVRHLRGGGGAAGTIIGATRMLGALGGSRMLGALGESRWMPGSRRGRWARAARRSRWGRRRMMLESRDWAMLGGLVGAIAAGLWLARRWSSNGEGIEVVRTMTVDAPVERVYEFWNDFENFPRFMSHVREVRRTGPDRTHWTVAGPAGAPVEWDAIVTRRVPNEEISWRTTDSSVVEHGGTVEFRPAGSGRTRIDIRMSYRPAGGALGQGLAALFGADPERVIGDDLSRLPTQLGFGRSAIGESGQRR